jgi:hypothetical protein
LLQRLRHISNIKSALDITWLLGLPEAMPLHSDSRSHELGAHSRHEIGQVVVSTAAAYRQEPKPV